PDAIAVGDFNGDGFGTGGDPKSVAVGDFNGDGKLDLVLANLLSNTVSILLGTGTGSFGPKTDFGTGGESTSVASGDFNGDGKLDLSVANAGSGTVSILLGTGTGSFGAKADFALGSVPLSVALADFNGDGRIDLAVTTVDAVSIMLGMGTGSFGVKTDFGAGANPHSVAVSDFSGDGKLDLAVANFADATVSILLNTALSLGFDSPTVSAQAGTKARVTVNINRSPGFTGNVTVTPPDPSMGIVPKQREPITTTDPSVTFKLKIKGSTPPGPHPVTFTARDDAGHTSAATLTVIVQ